MATSGASRRDRRRPANGEGLRRGLGLRNHKARWVIGRYTRGGHGRGKSLSASLSDNKIVFQCGQENSFGASRNCCMVV